MKLFELCRDRANPRRRCRGVDCRCQARYEFVTETAWRVLEGEQVTFCPGCGASYAAPTPLITTFVTCPRCQTKWRVRGNPILTLWHRLFGKHEGYNQVALWDAKTRYLRGDMKSHMEKIT